MARSKILGGSDSLIFLGWRKAWYRRTRGPSPGTYSNERLPLRTGLPQDDDGAECFAIDTSHQIGIPRAILLPKLSNLNF